MEPNRDFVAVMSSAFAKDAKLVLGCKGGGRSMRAANVLVQQGFTNVIDQRAGFVQQPLTAGPEMAADSVVRVASLIVTLPVKLWDIGASLVTGDTAPTRPVPGWAGSGAAAPPGSPGATRRSAAGRTSAATTGPPAASLTVTPPSQKLLNARQTASPVQITPDHRRFISRLRGTR